MSDDNQLVFKEAIRDFLYKRKELSRRNIKIKHAYSTKTRIYFTVDFSLIFPGYYYEFLMSVKKKDLSVEIVDEKNHSRIITSHIIKMIKDDYRYESERLGYT